MSLCFLRSVHCSVDPRYCIVENFHEFRSFVAICESFLHKIWGMASFAFAKVSNLRKFLRKCIFTISRKFSPSKVFCYTVCAKIYRESPTDNWKYTIVALICGMAKIIVHSALIRMNNGLRTVLGLNQDGLPCY